MPQQPVASIQNQFTKGLITEFSGLSFPENAATDCDNTVFTIVGNVTRRFGIDKEENGTTFSLVTGQAKTSYVWKNVGGDGNTQLEVTQTGDILSFFSVSTSTLSNPLSTNKLSSTVTMDSFAAGTFDQTQECTFADGNGYLFVFHPSCDPFYCTYTVGVITANVITVQIRDFAGIPELGVADGVRPTTLTPEHNYNLLNQGWGAGAPWSATSVTAASFGGTTGFTILAGLSGISVNQPVTVTSTGTQAGNIILTGTVTSYTSGTGALVVNVTSVINHSFPHVGNYNSWTIVPANTTYIDTWFSIVHNYPSNADQWWAFKNSSDVFDPATTQANVSVGSGPAPKGHFILNAFNQTRTAASSVVSLTDVTTTARPKTGCWFQGRVWYTGIDSSFIASGDMPYSTWTENIYFSQIVQGTSDFGQCYQQNDPTSEILFDLLPTDGGVISLIGSGSIYKLFTYQNGLLAFTANGIKFITGSQGIGFTANDYTVTDISSVRSISGTSFVNVNGIPYFWNEDGIYSVQPSKNGGLTVDPITVGTILQFFNAIPLSSKKYAHGSYHPIDYTIQWIYRDTESTGIADRYSFNKILNYITYNQAFFPYTVDNTTTSINTIQYVAGPGGLGTPEPTFKYLCSNGSNYSFADEHDDTYTDWASFTPTDYSSYFVTGYQIRGQAQKIFFPGYVWVFSNSSDSTDTAYTFNSIWDYASSGNSGRWSSERHVEIPPVNYGVYYRRHKVRGHGLALQFKVQSISGKNFDIIGWSSSDNVNTGI